MRCACPGWSPHFHAPPGRPKKLRARGVPVPQLLRITPMVGSGASTNWTARSVGTTRSWGHRSIDLHLVDIVLPFKLAAASAGWGPTEMSGSWPGSFPPMPGHGHFHPPPPMHWGMGPPNMPPPMPPFPGPPPPFSGGPPGPAQPATVYQQASQSDEIRTIYITGLPSDTKERELVNLMRFLPGHEVRCGGAGTPLVP